MNVRETQGAAVSKPPGRLGSRPSLKAPGEALRNRGMIGDYGKLDVVRLAPLPLYNSFAECWDAVQILKEIAQ